VLFRVHATAQPLTRWTLAAAVAACEACRELSGAAVEIKWPNDLIHGGLKLGGILTELRTVGNQDAELVIGTGINVGHRAEDLPAELAERATSLHLLSCGSMLERESLAAAYLRRLARVGERLRRGGWNVIASDFERLAPACRGAKVHVLVREAGAAREVHGVTHGIDPAGALLVRDAAGETTVVRMADAVKPRED
jgi:BirA family biotin operon repressor/biotin-[acetyl-CoA-carboxylase] ligase